MNPETTLFYSLFGRRSRVRPEHKGPSQGGPGSRDVQGVLLSVGPRSALSPRWPGADTSPEPHDPYRHVAPRARIDYPVLAPLPVAVPVAPSIMAAMVFGAFPSPR